MISKSQYTVELRRIQKVFDFDYDFYDEQFRCDFEDKFCDYYAFDEIGFESIERFKHNLRAHLNLNMPKWQQLYETELAAQDLNFLLNKDYRETFIRTVDTEDNLKGTNNSNTHTNITGSTSSDSDSTNNNTHKESNIPDGVSNVNLAENYLTGITSDSGSTSDHSLGSSTSDSNSSTNASNTADRNGKLLEKTELVGKGNIGVTSSAELLEKWRRILINLDKMIIVSCRDLFMGVF